MTAVAVAFTPAPASQSPNLRPRHDAAASYYAAMVVLFASLRRVGVRDADFRIVTTADIPMPFRNDFATLGVTELRTSFRHTLQSGRRFAASLYSIDAVEALIEAYPSGPILLLDPDCVAVRRPTQLFERATRKIGAYRVDYPMDLHVNGLSRRDAAALHESLDPMLAGVPVHYGGEYYGFTASSMRPVVRRATEGFWRTAGLPEGMPKIYTEEHAFNFALHGRELDAVNGEVLRIWTAPTYRNLVGGEESATIWHLPAEKDRGIRQLLPLVRDSNSWFWRAPEDAYRRRLGITLGIRRSLGRWTYDTTAQLVRELQAAPSVLRARHAASEVGADAD